MNIFLIINYFLDLSNHFFGASNNINTNANEESRKKNNFKIVNNHAMPFLAFDWLEKYIILSKLINYTKKV